jgi:hypothetical protein
VRTLFAVLVCATALSGDAISQEIGPAPAGDPTQIAAVVISRQFEDFACSEVIEATRLNDGSIRAICTNTRNERPAFRVFHHARLGNMAVNCAAASRFGISGC